MLIFFLALFIICSRSKNSICFNKRINLYGIIEINLGGVMMLGAIYGDKAGSIYEFSQLKVIKGINPQKLITDKSWPMKR